MRELVLMLVGGLIGAALIGLSRWRVRRPVGYVIGPRLVAALPDEPDEHEGGFI